jgi:hypothetical protein
MIRAVGSRLLIDRRSIVFGPSLGKQFVSHVMHRHDYSGFFWRGEFAIIGLMNDVGRPKEVRGFQKEIVKGPHRASDFPVDVEEQSGARGGVVLQVMIQMLGRENSRREARHRGQGFCQFDNVSGDTAKALPAKNLIIESYGGVHGDQLFYPAAVPAIS